MNCTVGMRMTAEEEELGADYFEHMLGPRALEDYYRDDEEGYQKARRESMMPRGALGSRAGVMPTLEEVDVENEFEAKLEALRKRHHGTNGSPTLDRSKQEVNSHHNAAYEAEPEGVDIKM